MAQHYYCTWTSIKPCISYPQIVHHLAPGEALTFNNLRCIHGRRSFNLNGGVRHLRVNHYIYDLSHSVFLYSLLISFAHSRVPISTLTSIRASCWFWQLSMIKILLPNMCSTIVLYREFCRTDVIWLFLIQLQR